MIVPNCRERFFTALGLTQEQVRAAEEASQTFIMIYDALSLSRNNITDDGLLADFGIDVRNVVHLMQLRNAGRNTAHWEDGTPGDINDILNQSALHLLTQIALIYRRKLTI